MSGILILKLNIAGSQSVNFRKVFIDSEGEASIDWKGKIYQSGWKDLYGYSFEIHENKLVPVWQNVLPKVLKNNDLLFKISNKIYNNSEYGSAEVPKLILMRPGPGTTSELKQGRGIFDSGKYKIKNTVKICTEVIKFLVDKFQSYFDKIYLRIKGHSRGGVAATQIVKNLSSTFRNNNKIKIRASFYDPVPGPDFWNHYGFNDPIDVSKNANVQNLKTAVIVSVNPAKPLGFRARYVKNSNVVVFTSLGHSVGTKNLYKDEKGEYSKPKWNYDGKILNFGRIYDLDDGIYFQTNQTILTDEKERVYDKENNEIIELDKEHNANCKSLIIYLTKIDFDSYNFEILLNQMNDKLKLKELWKSDSSRKELVLNLLNEKFHDKSKKIIYNKYKFEVVDRRESIFKKLYIYMCCKLSAISQKNVNKMHLTN